MELSAKYEDDIVPNVSSAPPPPPPPLGTTMWRCGTSMGQWWRGMESSTAIPIPVAPLTRRWSVWSLWYCRAVPVRSARLRLSLSESLWCSINSMSYGVVPVSLVSVSSVVSAVSPKDWKSECGLGTTASASTHYHAQ